jgi:hypothetical protein
MLSPCTVKCNGYSPPVQYAIDNGAWVSFIHEEPWCEDEFLRLVDVLGERADFVALPDVVTNREATIALSLTYVERLAGLRLYFVLQDGMGPDDADILAPHVDGYFLGGSTEYKIASMHGWGAYCRANGKRLHVGRVNTAKRIRLCHDAGAHSFDGSSVSRFARKNLRRLDNEVRQTQLFGEP